MNANKIKCKNSAKLLYAFFWVIPGHLNFICQRFGTVCLFHLHRWVGTYLPMKMQQTECSETPAYKIQTPENYPEESIQHSEHGRSLKSSAKLFSWGQNTVVGSG